MLQHYATVIANINKILNNHETSEEISKTKIQLSRVNFSKLKKIAEVAAWEHTSNQVIRNPVKLGIKHRKKESKG